MDKPACYRLCTARLEAGWGQICMACRVYVHVIADATKQRSKERAERYLREMGEERQDPEMREARRLRELEESKRRIEEKKGNIEEAVQVDQQRFVLKYIVKIYTASAKTQKSYDKLYYYFQGITESRIRPCLPNLLYEEPAEESRVHLRTHCMRAMRRDAKTDVRLF